jgi:hypothetical protein
MAKGGVVQQSTTPRLRVQKAGGGGSAVVSGPQ